MQEKGTRANARLEALFEKMSRYFDEHDVLSKDLISAKELYFTQTGKIGENDNEFGNRMNAFLMWFLFDYQLPSTMTTPVDYYIAYSKKNSETEDLEILPTLKEHTHSLFCFVKEKQDQIIIKDLFSNQKHFISGSRVLIGQEKDAFFETRIFEVDGEYYFANYFIYHPVMVRRDIKRQLKLIHKKRESVKPFLLKLHSYHTKWQRYRNININSIYHFNKSIPEAK